MKTVSIALFILAALSLWGCADSRHDQVGHETTFTDGPNGEEVHTTNLPPSPQTPPATPLPPNRISVTPYVIPAELTTQIAAAYPQVQAPAQTKAFTLDNPVWEIDPKLSAMTFRGNLTLADKQKESIELACKFDQATIPWSCSDMYPTSLLVAERRRLQATATCFQNYFDKAESRYKCRYLSVELFVSENGQTHSQQFQNQPFEIQRASSGDEDPGFLVPPVADPTAHDPLIQQKPTKEPVDPYTDEGEDEAPLSNTEATPLLNDPNVALEITTPLPTPAPTAGTYSIPGIETLRPQPSVAARPQAIGFHNDGTLRSGVELPMQGPGFKARQQDGRNFGTDLMIEMIQKVAAAVEAKFQGRGPIVVANIAQKLGGPMCSAAGNCHASHQTGLDADIVFPSKLAVKDMWNPCATHQIETKTKLRNGKTVTRSHTVCVTGSAIDPNLDDARFWQMLQGFTCDERRPVIAMFVDREIKKHLCAYAKAQGADLRDPTSCAFRTLQLLKLETGHFNHVHVRLNCPGNRECSQKPYSVPRDSGC